MAFEMFMLFVKLFVMCRGGTSFTLTSRYATLQIVLRKYKQYSSTNVNMTMYIGNISIRIYINDEVQRHCD